MCLVNLQNIPIEVKEGYKVVIFHNGSYYPPFRQSWIYSFPVSEDKRSNAIDINDIIQNNESYLGGLHFFLNLEEAKWALKTMPKLNWEYRIFKIKPELIVAYGYQEVVDKLIRAAAARKITFLEEVI